MPTKVRFAGVNHTQLPQIVSDGIALKGLPQTAGYPDGYGDLASAVNGLVGVYKNRGMIKVGGQVRAAAGVQNFTQATTVILQSRPARVRLHLINVSSSAINGVKASVAPSENITNPFVPSGTVSAFRAFNIATTIPPATILVGTDNVVQSEIVSEWKAVNPLPRADGDGFILMLRVFQDGTAAVGNRMNVGGSSNTTDEKYKVRTAIASTSGDFTLTSATFTENGFASGFWLEVDYETPTASLLTVGDSIMAGANSGPAATGSTAYGAAFIAVQQLQSEGYKIGFANGGLSGAAVHGSGTTLPDVVAGYLGNFLNYLEKGARPTIAAFCPWSVNNSGTYIADQAVSVAQSIGVFIAACEQFGVIPALVTPAPRNGLNSTDEGFRRQFVQQIKSYCLNNRCLLIDRDAVYTNYLVDTGGYKLPEWCLDNVHPTEAGHVAESVEWISALKKLA